MTTSIFTLTPGKITLSDLRGFYFGQMDVRLDDATFEVLQRAAESVERIVGRGEPVYGVNTGFGKLAKTRIPDDRLRDLQRNLVLSHAAGIGQPMPERVVRLILLLKANGLARGYSGVRPQIVQLLLDMLNRGLCPSFRKRDRSGLRAIWLRWRICRPW